MVVALLLTIVCVSSMLAPFDFSNNSLSLLVSVFSLIVGMSYPLLLQAIQAIDEQYHSPRLSNMLLQERKFIRFRCLLAISIACSFASIFILQILENHAMLTIIWVSLHTIVTLLLLVSTIQIFYLVLSYYHPMDFLDHIDDMRNNRE